MTGRAERKRYAQPPRCEPTALHKLRSGDYPVVYHVDEGNRVVTVLRVGHRHNVCKQGPRRPVPDGVAAASSVPATTLRPPTGP